ncbi:orexin receptor type 2-like isoform X1 [Haliotis rubra]|uniref:orexin receptor type 2-like isoform X1 n=2 Tax=Haliotis rubra TaxID=36100 RepID=UPI001EE539DD|nr:orexin receptor type 2-like isoform X1 [Haliotis rubra]XP_046582529.1 orexin receptor type 2-like isoform X1 [Haliotis rubra]
MDQLSSAPMMNASMMSPSPLLVNCSEPVCNSSLTEVDHDLLMQENDRHALQYIPVMIYVAMLMVTGVFGNGLVVYVYRRRFKKTSSNYFILTMAIFDLVACLIGMPTEIYDLRYPYAFYSSSGCKIFRFAETFSIYGSACVLLEIAFDRYFKICRPLMVISLFKIKMLCILAAVMALVLSAPAAVIFGISHPIIPNTNLMGYDCSIDKDYKNKVFQIVYYGVLMLIFVAFLLILTVLYIRIWMEIRSRQKMVIGDQISKPTEEVHERKKMRVKYLPSVSDEDSCSNSNGHTVSATQTVRSRFASLSTYASKLHVSRTTIVLFAVTVAFLISYLPAIVIMIIRSVDKSIEETQSTTAAVTSKLFSKFFLINNAINPIIYSFLNINFRRQAKIAIKKLLCCERRRRRYPQKCDSDRSTKKEMIPIDC